MKFEIIIHNPRKRLTVSANERIGEWIYNLLNMYIYNVETIADCAEWCESATEGESYHANNFDVYVREV